MDRSRARAVVDLSGVVVAVALSLIAVVTASRVGGSWAPQVELIGAIAATIAGARLVASIHRGLPAVIVVAVAVWIAIAFGVDPAGAGPLGGPFGYRNATGAFFASAVVAAAMVAVAFRSWPVRVVSGLAGLGFFLVAARASAAAGVVTACALLVAALALIGPRWARRSIAIDAALLAIVLGATVVLGATHEPGDRPSGPARPLVSALTERRLALWHDAIEILSAHPLGVGPDRFQDVSPTARADADARWAHDEFLQEGVELGWAGLALALLAFAWGFARLWLHPAPDGVVALGAAALAALGMHASVDYVLHFPAVPLAAAALVGAAQAAPRRRSDARHEPGPEGVEDGRHPAGVAGAPTPG